MPPATAPPGRSTGRVRGTSPRWRRYDAKLDRLRRIDELEPQEQRRARKAYLLSANVLKASEDKTFPGAIVASLASPVGAGGQRR